LIGSDRRGAEAPRIHLAFLAVFLEISCAARPAVARSAPLIDSQGQIAISRPISGVFPFRDWLRYVGSLEPQSGIDSTQVIDS